MSTRAMTAFDHSVDLNYHDGNNWFTKMGLSGPSLLEQDEPTGQQAARRPTKKVCKRKFCLSDCHPQVVLDRMDADEVPHQHNRGWEKIAQPTKFRTAMCKHYASGHCCNGPLCWMAHAPSDRRTVAQNQADGLVSTQTIHGFIVNELRQSEQLSELVERVMQQMVEEESA